MFHKNRSPASENENYAAHVADETLGLQLAKLLRLQRLTLHDTGESFIVHIGNTKCFSCYGGPPCVWFPEQMSACK